MSNIYILEPPTNGKVLLETSVGQIEIELWPKEAPKACRNFVQHCLDGYYDKTIFHRVVKGFLVQGGDPTGTGNGGESIYGKPFKDEFHSRLRFVRRGLVAMASTEPDDNRSQFIFTLDKCPELNNKNTIFGKVVGDTIYNMVTLGESPVDHDERPYHPHKIIRTEVLNNPFPDLVPRVVKTKEDKRAKEEASTSSKATKNFSLLSFGEEAMEDDEELAEATEKIERKKGKSSHDLANDPCLLNVSAVEVPREKESESNDSSEESNSEEIVKSEKVDAKAASSHLASALKKAADERATVKGRSQPAKQETRSDDEDEEESPEDMKRKAVRDEIAKLKQELVHGKAKDTGKLEEEKKEESKEAALASWAEERARFRQQTETSGSQLKGAVREKATLDMLAKFQSKLKSVTTKLVDFDEEGDESEPEDNAPEASAGSEDIIWMRNPLVFRTDEEQQAARSSKVIDAAAVKVDEERYSISDPRNPLNKRRREAGKTEGKASARDAKRSKEMV